VPGGGRLFHTLPLPISTQLPVHINAAVTVSSNRRSVCNEDDDNGVWNRAVLGGLAKACYAHALQRAAQELMNESVHVLLPLQAAAPYAEYLQVMIGNECIVLGELLCVLCVVCVVCVV
jgi:hypothetical protein